MNNIFKSTKLRLAVAAGTACLALGACSGDEDGTYLPTPAATSVPASAGASISAFVSYLLALSATETGEPLSLADVTPPVDETSEPTAITVP